MKTDNSYLEEKVNLRLESLPDKQNVFVLECYAGKGLIWDTVKERTSKDISILRIEKQRKKNKGFHLHGDNVKFLSTLDLSQFDIIDLDAYGVPSKQLNIIFNKKYKGIIHVTAIQTGMGKLPNDILLAQGYSLGMINKIPSLFNTNGFGKLRNFLYLHGVKQVTGFFIDRKNYFYFKT